MAAGDISQPWLKENKMRILEVQRGCRASRAGLAVSCRVRHWVLSGQAGQGNRPVGTAMSHFVSAQSMILHLPKQGPAIDAQDFCRSGSMPPGLLQDLLDMGPFPVVENLLEVRGLRVALK